MASNRKFNVPINLLSLAYDPASADEGDVYYNTTDDRVRVYKNSTWVNLAYSDDVGITSIDYITFDTTPEASSTATGTMYWDSGDGLPKVILNPNVEIGVGQTQVALVKNATGSAIDKGKVVYINGAQGQRPTIALADADAETTSSKTLGLTSESIADGAEGFVTTFGVLRGVDTFGLTEGSALWLSSTTGGYQTSIPAEPAHLVFVGYVVKAHATAGEIFINPQNGYELNELHGVTVDATPADNEVLAYDTTSGIWINQTAPEAGLIDTSSTSQTKTGNFTAAEVHATAKLVGDTVGGDEGGEILLGKPETNTTIAGTGVTIDVWQNKLRFFEQGGSARGYYIDITGGGAGVGTNLVGGGSASDSFKTISVSGQSDVVADSSTDTLTLVAGSNVTITTNATSDSITIAATDTNTTYTADGTSISLVGTQFSHADTSTQASVNNSGNTFIQDITLDTYGHITAITSAAVSFSGYATTSGTLAQFGATTSSQLAGVISDETGSGALVFGTSPTIATPTIDVINASSVSATTPSLYANTTTGTINIGAALTTGTLNIDSSTDTHTANYSAGSIAPTKTKTVNLGTGAGGGTANINIGAASGGTTTISSTTTTVGSTLNTSSSTFTFAAGATTLNIGTPSSTSTTINIGPTGTATGTVNIANSSLAHDINIGTGAGAASIIDIGTNSQSDITLAGDAIIISGNTIQTSNVGVFSTASDANVGVFGSTALDTDTAVRTNFTSASYTGNMIRMNMGRAGTTAASFFVGYSNWNATQDLEITLRGNGSILSDVAATTPADYAEYFEWEDGNPDNEDRAGLSVKLVGNKIILATENSTDIIGIVSARPAIIGDSAWSHWTDKYLKDNLNREIMEDYQVIQWYNENGDILAYDYENMPEGIEIPEEHWFVTQQREKLNPAYNPELVYIPREDRKEWSPVGLLGKLRVFKGQPVNPNWIKMRDIDEQVEEWLVR